MRTFSRFIFFLGFVFTALFCMSTVVHCQEQKDRIIITVGAGADELTDFLNTSYYEYAIKIAANAKIVSGSNVRLGGKFVFDKLENIKRYSAGPELSYNIKFVEPYAHFLLGAEITPDRNFIRTVGAGVRLNFGHIVLNPIQVDSTRGVRAPFGSAGVTQFSASIGVRF